MGKNILEEARMRKKKLAIFCAIIFLTLCILIVLSPKTNNFSPQSVLAATPDFPSLTFFKLLGQNSPLETGKYYVSGFGIDHSAGVHIDKTSTPNKVYVVDTGNSRILGYNGAGSCSQNSTVSCTANSDCGNANSCVIDGSKQPDIVIGQENFSTGSCNRDNNNGVGGSPSSSSLCLMGFAHYANNTGEAWTRLTIDTNQQGDLVVPDFWNNRVLTFKSPLSSEKIDGKGDATADFVYGQDTFSTNGANKGNYFENTSNPTDSSLHINFGPPDNVSSRGVSVDGNNNIWVADTFNNRVLRFQSGNKTADLVIGQSGFNQKGCGTNDQNAPTSLNTLCAPTLAKINPQTGELYVTDEYPNGFKSRFVVFSPPFSNGMTATRTFTVQQPLVDDGSGNQVAFTNWGGLYGNGQFVSQITGFAFNPTASAAGQTEYERGDLWINELSNNRTLLIDDSGKIEKVIGARGMNLRGGGGNYDFCVDMSQGFNLSWPGGGIGIDSDNALYLADETFNRVVKYNTPYSMTGNCLPAPAGGLFPGTVENVSDREKENIPLLGQQFSSINITNRIGGAVGMVLHKGQLLLLDQADRMRVWNNYLTKNIGAAPDFLITGGMPSRIWFGKAVDDLDRLWFYNGDGKLKVLQLPITSNNQAPLKDSIKLYWADDPTKTSIPYHLWETGMTFDKVNKKLYIADSENNRILRVSNYGSFADPSGLAVDMVIGQPGKDSTNCEDIPSANRTCLPKALQFDKQGNLYAIENTYECHANDRIVMYSAASLNQASGLFPNIAASNVLVAPSLTQKGPCGYSTIGQPGSPVTLDFTSANQLVVGNDGYYGNREERPYRQLWFYNNPLTKSTPDGYINLPMGTPGEIVIDEQDNLYIQDHSWFRIFGINPRKDPALLISTNGTSLIWGSNSTPTPTKVPTPTPTRIPTPTPTRIPTATPTRTPTPTPRDTTAPVITFTAPLNNAVIPRNQTYQIKANATDASGISKVEFYVGSTLRCTDTGSPYTCNWSVPSSRNTTYSLSAKAFDTKGNTKSAVITVRSSQ